MQQWREKTLKRTRAIKNDPGIKTIPGHGRASAIAGGLPVKAIGIAAGAELFIGVYGNDAGQTDKTSSNTHIRI